MCRVEKYFLKLKIDKSQVSIFAQIYIGVLYTKTLKGLDQLKKFIKIFNFWFPVLL